MIKFAFETVEGRPVDIEGHLSVYGHGYQLVIRGRTGKKGEKGYVATKRVTTLEIDQLGVLMSSTDVKVCRRLKEELRPFLEALPFTLVFPFEKGKIR